MFRLKRKHRHTPPGWGAWRGMRHRCGTQKSPSAPEGRDAAARAPWVPRRWRERRPRPARKSDWPESEIGTWGRAALLCRALALRRREPRVRGPDGQSWGLSEWVRWAGRARRGVLLLLMDARSCTCARGWSHLVPSSDSAPDSGTCRIRYHDDVYLYFYNSTASTWTLATPRTTWESKAIRNLFLDKLQLDKTETSASDLSLSDRFRTAACMKWNVQL